MESHILNSYHAARYQIHGHNRMASTRESYSSESSGYNHDRAEYSKYTNRNKYINENPDSSDDDEWDSNLRNDVHRVKKEEVPNAKSESENEDEIRLVYENDRYQIHDIQNLTRNFGHGINECDYDIEIDSGQASVNNEPPVIYVFAVDPELDLEYTSEEEDWHIKQNESEEVEPDSVVSNEDENVVQTSAPTSNESGETELIEAQQKDDKLDLSFEMPAVINVDDFFIKENKNHARPVNVEDRPVVSNIDEYFIKDNYNTKDTSEKLPKSFSANENKESSRNLSQQHQPCSVPLNIKKEPPQEETASFDGASDTLTERVRIDSIKRFLMEDLPGVKGNAKPMQRSCSLPHSPTHIPYMDVDDGRTSFSFEDLNISDLPELNFDEETEDKDIAKASSENGDVPRTLTDEDIKEFLIPNKSIKIENDKDDEDVDNFNEIDMDLEAPINSIINYSSPAINLSTEENKIQSKPLVPVKQKNTLKNIMSNVTTSVPKLLKYSAKKSDRAIKIEVSRDTKVDGDDYVDVESFNETTSIPVLEANNLNSLLEQFEATEKLNNSDVKLSKRNNLKVTDSSQRSKISNGLTSGTRLQDAAIQLNKNKIRQILISTAASKCTVPKKSDATVHSDHDYCSPKKRQSIITSIKKGQSLLKPEVLSSNNRILKSRHRTCKNKKVVYHISSDDEADSGVNNNNNNKNKTCVKPSAKSPLQTNHRKKLSPVYSVPSVSVKCDNHNSVMSHTASKASGLSQGSTGSIKLTIKNKSKVILNLNCDPKKDSLEHLSGNIESVKIKDSSKIVPKNKKNIEKNKKSSPICVNEFKNVCSGNSIEPLVIKEENRPIKQESKDFYMTLFDNKQDLKISFDTSTPKKEMNEKLVSIPEPVLQQITPEIKQPTKKKLNLQEYKLRKEGGSTSNSRTVSPEAIFPDIPNVRAPKACENTSSKLIPTVLQPKSEKSGNTVKLSTLPLETVILKTEPIECPMNVNDQQKVELIPPKKIFDPISEASRKILMNTKKQKAEAMRKRDEDIVMSKIPKIENYKPQPLAEILNITEKIPEVSSTTPIAIISPKVLDFEEIVMVSVGVNTDPEILKTLEPLHNNPKTEIKDNKLLINFKIKKSDNVLKHNVFENVKTDRKSPQKDNKSKRQLSPNNCKELKIDKERYRNITKTLKHVERNVEAKISSNSLFASIQDVVKKSKIEKNNDKDVQSKEESTKFENNIFVNNSNKECKNIPSKVTIVRDYEKSNEHGEDKVILHLDKGRTKPLVNDVVVQTDEIENSITDSEQNSKEMTTPVIEIIPESAKIRKRRESDMSLSSECSPVREINIGKPDNATIVIKPNEKPRHIQEHQVKCKERPRTDSVRSSSRYDSKSYRRRSLSKNRSKKTSKTRSSRSRSRYRSRSPDRYRRYRRSDSPYRRKRSPYRPSSRRDFKRSKHSSHKSRHRTKSRSKSHSKYVHNQSKTPVPKKTQIYPNTSEVKMDVPKKFEINIVAPPKADTAMTPPPPIRKPTVSECSESSSSSNASSSSSSSSSSESSNSSSSGSSSDRSSVKRRYSSSPDKNSKKSKLENPKKVNENCTRSYSSDGRDSSTSVEERKIVFVGKLEQEITKLALKSKFLPFGPITEVTLHSKEDGTRYGFVTYKRPRDAWTAVEAACTTFPSYDVGFGGRRAFCRQSYADLDGLEAEYSECAYTGDREARADSREDMSFEQMLLDMKKKLSRRKQVMQKTEEPRVDKDQP